jgi:hypothetical protein
MLAHHGTHHADLPLHSGLCLAYGGRDDGYRAASAYARRVAGEHVFEVDVDLTGLVVVDLPVDVRACYESDEWPGDTAASRRALLAAGADAVAYADECLGCSHRTIRLLSDRALAAVRVTGVYDPA